MGVSSTTGRRVRQLETAEQRAARLAWEAARLAEAEADVVAGRVISGEAVSAWIERSRVPIRSCLGRAPQSADQRA